MSHKSGKLSVSTIRSVVIEENISGADRKMNLIKKLSTQFVNNRVHASPDPPSRRLSPIPECERTAIMRSQGSCVVSEWNGGGGGGHDRVKRQLSVSSDSKLLDDDIREETKVILRPRKPPRPKSEVLLNQGSDHRRTKRYSAFGVSTGTCANKKLIKFTFYFIEFTKWNLCLLRTAKLLSLQGTNWN